MATKNHLLDEIETFLAETGMGPSYFGKQAVKNSEIVSRLRKGGRIWPETEAQLRAFMLAARRTSRESARVA
jgi:hypothetical protein